MNLLGKNKFKNLVFGGTFDPIHNGHIKIVEKIIFNFSPEKIYIIPTGNPYMKPKPPIASSLQRLEMCKIAFANFDRVEIIDYEALRDSPSYTFDTLNFLASRNIQIDTLVLGEDSFSELDNWKEGLLLRKNYKFIVIKRNESSQLDLDDKNFVYLDHISLLSSSDIRKKIALNKQIITDTSIEIANYIENNMIYKNGQNK